MHQLVHRVGFEHLLLFIDTEAQNRTEKICEPDRTVVHARRFSSPARAASTSATDAGRPADNGTIVSGNKVVFRSGSTGISNGSAPNFCAGSWSVCSLDLSLALGIVLKK